MEVEWVSDEDVGLRRVILHAVPNAHPSIILRGLLPQSKPTLLALITIVPEVKLCISLHPRKYPNMTTNGVFTAAASYCAFLPLKTMQLALCHKELFSLKSLHPFFHMLVRNLAIHIKVIINGCCFEGGSQVGSFQVNLMCCSRHSLILMWLPWHSSSYTPQAPL